MGLEFPVFYVDPTDPQSTVYIVASFEEAEHGGLEEFDVVDENFVIWDSTGVRVRAAVKREGCHWLELTSTAVNDMCELRKAISLYAAAVGVPPKEVRDLSPVDAVKRLEEVEEHRRGPRRWYQFWR